MNRYEPRTPRALAGLAAVCMTAATLALSVMAPAAIESESRDAGVAATSTGIEDHAFTNAGPLTTSIDVVAYRTKRVVPVVQSRAQLRTGAAS